MGGQRGRPRPSASRGQAYRPADGEEGEAQRRRPETRNPASAVVGDAAFSDGSSGLLTVTTMLLVAEAVSQRGFCPGRITKFRDAAELH